MLAYNVAYFCLTQGLEIRDVETAMNPGRNLYRLLIGEGPGPHFGKWSHATTGAGYLGSNQGELLLLQWDLNLKDIIKTLETVVHGHHIKLEWDLVEEVGGEEEEEHFPVMERKSTRRGSSEQGAGHGTSGWTRVPTKSPYR